MGSWQSDRTRHVGLNFKWECLELTHSKRERHICLDISLFFSFLFFNIYTPNLGSKVSFSDREREQGRLRGSSEGATGEHEGAQREHRGRSTVCGCVIWPSEGEALGSPQWLLNLGLTCTYFSQRLSLVYLLFDPREIL